ncbi:MAG: flagellar basal body L-ring protein FlgH [Planctomycetales bacterium]
MRAQNPDPMGEAIPEVLDPNAAANQQALPLRPEMPNPRNGVPPTQFGPNGMARSRGPLPQRPPQVRDYSWIYIDPPPEPRKLKVHDIITVIVDEKSEATENSQFTRQKNGTLKLALNEFVRIDNQGNLNNAAQNSPTIDGTMQGNLITRGVLQSREGLRYRIAASVVDIQSNGILVLEARKSIRTNRDLWTYTLSGRVRPEDVLANNTVMSENLADLDVQKSEKGRVRDSTRRGIILTLYDFLSPF